MLTDHVFNRPGLGSGSQLTCRVSLVFPTKGSSPPNDTMTSLNPSEHPHFPLCVALPPGFANSLPLSIFSLELPTPSSHSILLFIA